MARIAELFLIKIGESRTLHRGADILAGLRVFNSSVTGKIAHANPSVWKDMAGSQRYMAYFGDFEFGMQDTQGWLVLKGQGINI